MSQGDETTEHESLIVGRYDDLVAAAQAVVRRWREGRSSPDEIGLLDVALAQLAPGADEARLVEGEVPAAWYLDMRAERDRLLKRLAVAEAYIPSKDFADYQGDAAKVEHG